MIIAAALIAVALAAQPAESPKPKGISKSKSAQSAANPEGTHKPNKPAETGNSFAAPTPTAPASDGSTNASKSNASGDAENIRIQGRIEIFTGALAGVGFLQVCVMIVQLVIYCRQAREMRRQRHEMRRQRHVMFQQWETMDGQLAQMRSSGEQTDRMIEQIAKQVAHMETSAIAAKKSADSFVNAERAWVQVHIVKQPAIQTSLANARIIERVWFWPDVINIGRTPAILKNLIVVTCQVRKPLGDYSQMPTQLPPEPIYNADHERRVIGIERDMMLPPTAGVNPLPIEIRGDEWDLIQQRKVTLYLYGFVDYLDVSGNSRQTRFCELYWVPFIREDPNPQGFVTAGNTPAAYTECT